MTDTSSTIGSTTGGNVSHSSPLDQDSQFYDAQSAIDQFEESMIASSMGDVSMIQPPVIEIDLPPELIKEYTEGFKLYEQKKTIKPAKPTPVVAVDPKAKGAVKKEDPKAKKVADKKGAVPVEEPPPGPVYDFTVLKGHVLLSDLLTLMRGLLKNPRESELPKYLSVLPNCEEVLERKQINLDEFLKIMALNDLPDQDNHFDILDAFETFDPDFKGEIEPETLKNILLTMGDLELASKEEVDEIVNTFCNRTTKAIYYDDILKTCLSNTETPHNPDDPIMPTPSKPKPTKTKPKTTEQYMSTMATVISATTMTQGTGGLTVKSPTLKEKKKPEPTKSTRR